MLCHVIKTVLSGSLVHDYKCLDFLPQRPPPNLSRKTFPAAPWFTLCLQLISQSLSGPALVVPSIFTNLSYGNFFPTWLI